MVDAAGEPVWISMVDAAGIVGCSTSAIRDAVRRGDIAQRPDPDRSSPSLDPQSVQAWAVTRRTRVAAIETRRKAEVEHRARSGRRPDSEHVWVAQYDAAKLLGISPTWVSNLARRDRLPYTVASGQRWFREDHLRSIVAAREWEERSANGAEG